MDETRYIVAGSFIDGSSTVVNKNIFIAVKEGIITAVGPLADLPNTNPAEIDNFSHCTLLPAFIDCSVSLSRSPSVDMRVRLADKEAGIAQKAVLFEKHISYCHAYGVMGVADCDEITDLLKLSQKRIADENIIEIQTPALPDLTDEDRVDLETTSGDFLKLYYSSNIEDEVAPSPVLTQANLYTLLSTKGSKKAIVVANGEQKVKEALDAGCDAIEQGYAMGEENLRKMAEKNVLWIPSVLRAKNGLDSSGSSGDVCCRFSQRYVAPGKPIPGAEAFWKKMLNEHLMQLRRAKQFGVRTAIGTGAGSVGILHGESMAEEMKLFIKAGYSLEETIRCASETGARFFGFEKLGALTVGRKATFLISRGSVKQLPRKLSYLEGIYVDGVPSGKYRK